MKEVQKQLSKGDFFVTYEQLKKVCPKIRYFNTEDEMFDFIDKISLDEKIEITSLTFGDVMMFNRVKP